MAKEVFYVLVEAETYPWWKLVPFELSEDGILEKITDPKKAKDAIDALANRTLLGLEEERMFFAPLE